MGDMICFGVYIFCFLLFAGLGTFVMFSKTPEIVSLFNVLVAGLFIFLLMFVGVPVLIVIYTKVIRTKYMEA